MLSSQEDQHERREVQHNDQLVRQQQQEQTGSTFHQHAQASANDLAGGRWSGQGAAFVVGSTPQVNYPAAGPHQSDPVGQEPALGYRINDLEPAPAVQATDPTSDDAPPASPLSGAQRADVGSLSLAAQGTSQMSSSTSRGEEVRPERSPVRRF
jgi:hypothetical protein